MEKPRHRKTQHGSAQAEAAGRSRKGTSTHQIRVIRAALNPLSSARDDDSMLETMIIDELLEEDEPNRRR